MCRILLITIFLSAISYLSPCQLFSESSDQSSMETYDVIVYGGTSGGVAAAVQAGRMGKSVVLIGSGYDLGGMTSSGLGATDYGHRESIGGLSQEFYRRIKQYYMNEDAWKYETREEFIQGNKRPLWRQGWTDMFKNEDEWYWFEPHAADDVFQEMCAEADVKVVFNERLDLIDGVDLTKNTIDRIRMESGRVFKGDIYIDATYEGDLMAKAGVSYTYGRESTWIYNEKYAGVRTPLTISGHQFYFPLDPYKTPGDPSSGLVPHIHSGSSGEEGQGDNRIQAYCFRLVLTDVKENQVPFSRPPNYDPANYELFLRYLQAGVEYGQEIEIIGRQKLMPNRKSDTNNHGAFSTDAVGMNYDYPEATHDEREEIIKQIKYYTQGLIWFVLTDPRVPEHAMNEMKKWGHAKDEFVRNEHWPPELYIREARRMIGKYIMTQHNCLGDEIAPKPICLASYTMDSHITQRYVDKHGHVRNEGTLGGRVPNPYPVDYDAIIPKNDECTNLLVPVCLSTTHASYGSIRMEPVFMALGQSAGTAAVLALNNEAAVQDVDYNELKEKLLADKQILTWEGPRRTFYGIDPMTLDGIIMDEHQATLDGFWRTRWLGHSNQGQFISTRFIHDCSTHKGEKQAHFVPDIPQTGKYEVRISNSFHPIFERASSIKVVIRHAKGITEKSIQLDEVDDLFISAGTYTFEKGRKGRVALSNGDSDGYVIVDAVQFLEKN